MPPEQQAPAPVGPAGDVAGRTAILINRDSGTVRSLGEEAVTGLIRDAFRSAQAPKILLVSGSEVNGAARRLAAAGDIGRVIVGGGDGTVTSVAGLLAGTGVAMGVLPLGTMNLLANALGMPTDLAESLRQLQNAEVRAIDAGRAAGRLFLHHVSMGVQPRMVKVREKLGYSSRLTKMLAGFRAMVTVLLNPQSQRLRLTIDGTDFEIKSPVVLVSNNIYEDSRWLKQAALDQGILGIYIVKPMSFLAYAGLALDLLRGRWRDNLNVREEHGRSVTLQKRRRFGRRAKSIRATMDGELTLLPLPLTISSERAALKVLVPLPPKP